MKKKSQAANFFLLTENSFHSSYLVSEWYATFQNHPGFRGIIIRKDKNDILQHSREQFHQLHHNKKCLTSEEIQEMRTLYGGISKAEEVMIRWFGIPASVPNSLSRTIFLGENINSEEVKIWLEKESRTGNGICIFVFLDKILNPWWIQFTKGNIINAHSAVLPYARGTFAIENMAYRGNPEEFQRATGASVHYVDEGVDTGPIIRAARIKDPFAFQSLSEVKAYSYRLAFDLLIQEALEMVKNPQIQPVAIKADPALFGPVFSRRNYTSDVEELAEKRFIEMKQSWKA